MSWTLTPGIISGNITKQTEIEQTVEKLYIIVERQLNHIPMTPPLIITFSISVHFLLVGSFLVFAFFSRS